MNLDTYYIPYAKTDANSIEEFLAKYAKRSFWVNEDQEIKASITASFYRDFNERGCVAVSHHTSVTGEPVAYYGNNLREAKIKDAVELEFFNLPQSEVDKVGDSAQWFADAKERIAKEFGN